MDDNDEGGGLNASVFIDKLAAMECSIRVLFSPLTF